MDEIETRKKRRLSVREVAGIFREIQDRGEVEGIECPFCRAKYLKVDVTLTASGETMGIWISCAECGFSEHASGKPDPKLLRHAEGKLKVQKGR